MEMSVLVPSLGDEEESVYRLLVSTGGAGCERVADALGWEPARAGRALGTLRQVRLVQACAERDDTWVAVDPATATLQFTRPLEGAIQAWQAQVEGIRGRLSALTSVYAAGARPGDTVVSIAGLPDLIASLDETAARCTGEVVTVQPLGKGVQALAAHAAGRDRALLGRGVRVRAVFPHLARHDTVVRDYAEAVSVLGGEVRTTASTLPALVVFDRSVAYLLDEESVASAQRVTNPALVGFVMQAVENAWVGGETFSAATGGNRIPDLLAGETKETIVRLLAAGYKDEVVARRLGIALRTCRKYIAEIFDDLGAQSRFQAGWLVRERLAAAARPAPAVAGAVGTDVA